MSSPPLTLGARRGGTGVVDLMLDCHERIRRFSAMACRLAAGVDAAPADISGTAHAVRRYFAEAMPLHVADEELDLVPRLAGRDAAVDAALARMSAEHTSHAPRIARLVELCTILVDSPARIAELADELAPLTTALAAELDAHLELEERTIFPAARLLPEADREALLAAVRARRNAA